MLINAGFTADHDVRPQDRSAGTTGLLEKSLVALVFAERVWSGAVTCLGASDVCGSTASPHRPRPQIVRKPSFRPRTAGRSIRVHFAPFAAKPAGVPCTERVRVDDWTGGFGDIT